MQDFGLYVIITKPVLAHQTIAEICVENKIKMLQLREKDIPDRDLLKIAKDVRNITNNTATKFVINDRPDIAKLCNADFVHLGQNDLDVTAAKKILKSNQAIGLSTHSLQQARAALQQNPDYIGFGPVFATPTKAIPDPVVGVSNLTKALKFSLVPVVAIGGIFPENLEQVLQAGAKNIAMVRYFMTTKNLDNRIKEIKKYMGNQL
jgi:thiamine-phosphate pyrophosphorylase